MKTNKVSRHNKIFWLYNLHLKATEPSPTVQVRILLDCHPEMVGKYTAYGSMIYTHTPLHLASRNGHTRYSSTSLPCPVSTLVQGGGGAAAGGAGHQREDSTRHRAA